MKNITSQYQLLKEGKMTKSAFVRSARMSFPQFISPVTSFNDAVSILKGKRLLSEEQETATNDMNENTGGREEIIAQFLRDKGMTYEPDELDYQDAEELQRRLAAAGYSDDFDLGGGFGDDEFEDDELYEKKHLKEAKTNSGYTYIQEKPTTPEIDLVNPYQLKKGVEFELSKMGDLSGNAYMEAVDKAVKGIMKDKDKYKDLQIANYKEVKKVDEQNKMVEVGKKSKTKENTDHSGYLKKPVKKDEKSNVSDKKENKKGKPKGVKEMTNKPKTAAGISKTMELPGKEKVLKALKEHLNKKKVELNEDMHHEYSHGMEVHTPSGVGRVHEIVGSTITVELANGGMKDYQVNVLNKQKEVAKEAPQMEAPKKGVTKEQVMNKLKEFFSKKKVKEAKKFKLGGDIVVKSDAEANSYETDLKKAGAKYTKSNA